MSIELKIPAVGESVREVQIARWLKQEGDAVEQDEDLVELDTDKASMDLPAPAAGKLSRILKSDGETVSVGDVIGYIEQNGKLADDGKPTEPEPEPQTESKSAREDSGADDEAKPAEEPTDEPTDEPTEEATGRDEATPQQPQDLPATPSARRAMREHGLTADEVKAAGPRITRSDVLSSIDQDDARPAPRAADSSLEETVPMSLIRRRIAERLVAAQRQAALLTTFNEIDMSAVKALRAEHRERFQDKYGVKLGFMSFFVKAAVDALRQHPEINAEIRDETIVYRNYQHIGIAIGGERGLVVPVLRYAERLSFAEIERAINDFAERAANKKLTPEEMQDGTFTITNGGVYGSLLSTPIVNPPQSGVLGMHAIEDRPVARAGQVVIRPMMYVALTYDHRIVDGRDAVTFLKRVKETIEDPARMLLEV